MNIKRSQTFRAGETLKWPSRETKQKHATLQLLDDPGKKNTHTPTNRQRKYCSWLGLLKKTMFDAKTGARRLCRGNSDKRHG